MHLGYRVTACWAVVCLVSALGCNSTSYKTAPVSGVVKLDGMPLVGASVNFVPQSTDPVNPGGSGSYGKTDETGRYTLKLIENDGAGAAVGTHKVSISAPQGDDRTKEGGIVTDRVPPRYRGSETTLTFEVVPGGSKEANFDLTSTTVSSGS